DVVVDPEARESNTDNGPPGPIGVTDDGAAQLLDQPYGVVLCRARVPNTPARQRQEESDKAYVDSHRFSLNSPCVVIPVYPIASLFQRHGMNDRRLQAARPVPWHGARRRRLRHGNLWRCGPRNRYAIAAEPCEKMC